MKDVLKALVIERTAKELKLLLTHGAFFYDRGNSILNRNKSIHASTFETSFNSREYTR